MNKSVTDSITCLMNLLNNLGFHTVSHTKIKMILSNDSECVSSVLQMLFDCLQYVKHDYVDQNLYTNMLDQFNIDLVCLFISEELRSLGYLSTEDELRQPINVFLIIGYVLAQFVLEKIMRLAVFNTNPIQVIIPRTLKTDKSIPLFESDDVAAWTVLRHRLQSVSKQVESLITSLENKNLRLNQHSPNIDAEVLYLMKNESLLSQYVNELKTKNEHLKFLSDWIDQESVFWEWFSSLRINRNVSNTPIHKDQIKKLQECKNKLLQLESTSKLLDSLWFELNKVSDISESEVLGEINAEVYIGNESVHAYCIPPVPCDPRAFIALDNKIQQTIEQFDMKYLKKMKKLSRYTDALILDGSL